MAELLKNMYNQTFIDRLSKKMQAADSNFNSDQFKKDVRAKDWDDLELKARTERIAASLVSNLPYSYKKQIIILKKVAPDFTGFTGTIFPTIVELYGIEEFEISIEALKYFTAFSTSEFAIRPFIIKYPETLNHLYAWSKDENHHVRRLASEGCRPLLPWAMKLHQFVADPAPILPILETLRNDSEDYVYRSVANNLNDISKNHPELVLNLCENWVKESKTTYWVAKHALRTLLKKGNQRAMQFFGFGAIDGIEIVNFKVEDDHVSLGGSTNLQLTLNHIGELAKYRIEYAIGFLKKQGHHNEKVFQIKEAEFKKGEKVTIFKKLDFKELSTRKHYRGEHYIVLKVNGIDVQKINFLLF